MWAASRPVLDCLNPCVVAACRPPIPPLGCPFSFFLSFSRLSVLVRVGFVFIVKMSVLVRLGSGACKPRRGAGERAARARKGPPSTLLYMVTDKKRKLWAGTRCGSDVPPLRRSRVTHMNREEKVSPTYHHRRSTGAPILSQPGGLGLREGVECREL